MPIRYNRQTAWVLVAILGLACYLRLASVTFGLPALNDPDELIFEMGALRMLRGLTLDPGWFGHPATTTMYVLALIDAGVFAGALLSARVASPRQFGEMVYADPTWIILPGRVAMVMFALGTVWLTWRLADRLFGRPAAVAAALLVAFDPVHITWSQIIRSDMMACFFMLLCLQSSVAIARAGQWRDYRWAALWLGVAIATKWPFALAFLAIGAATLQALRAGRLTPRQAITRVTGAGFAAVGVLVLVSPYLVIDYPTVLSNLKGEGQAHHLGANGGDLAFNFRWYLDGAFYWGFGILGLGLIFVGAARVLRDREAFAILVPVTVAFVTLLCLQRLVWERWALPLMLLGTIIAAAGLIGLIEWARRPGVPRLARWLPPALLVATLVPLVARDIADARARMNDTRQLASAWAWRHIPPGATVLVEHQASDIVGGPWRLLFPIGDAGCVEIAALLRDRTSYATIQHARADRANADYGTLADAQRPKCHADFAILAQFDRYRQERSLFPHEYAAYLHLIATGSVVAIIAPQPGRIGGPLVTIVDLRKASIH